MRAFIGRARRLTLAYAAAAVLQACTVKTSVVATSVTAPQVSHVYLTVAALWLNTSASAKVTDGTWAQVLLKEPVTVDLYDPSHSLLPAIITGSTLPPGTYAQLRLVLVGNVQSGTATPALARSASALGLSYNNEVTYNAGSGETTVPLEFATPFDPAMLLSTDIVLKGQTSGSTSTPSGGTTATATVTIGVDALRHIQFLTQTFNRNSSRVSTQTFALFSGTGSAQEAAATGGITGTLDLSALNGSVTSDPQGIVATAEYVDGNSNRQVAGNATIQVSGTSGVFTIFPLLVNATGSTSYDVVIHGPGIQPLVVTSVPVKAGAVSAATAISTTALSVSPATEAIPYYRTQMPPVTTSALGLVATSGSVANTLPAASDIGFYQTLTSPASSVPYLMETAALNPMTRQFSTTAASDPLDTSNPAYVELTNSSILVGTYNSGGAIAVAAQNPLEGRGTYSVVAGAHLFSAPIPTGTAPTVSAPGSSNTVITLLPAPPLSASGVLAPLTVTIAASTTQAYDGGTLIVSAGGRVVDAVDLASALALAPSGPLTLQLRGVPSGSASIAFPQAVYDFEVRVWNSGYPLQGVRYSARNTPLDLSQIPISTVALQLP